MWSKTRTWVWVATGAALLLGASFAPATATVAACPQPAAETISGLPLPRPARVRAEANLREGPSLEHSILARTEQEMAVSVRAECFHWRLIRTADGREGWAHAALLRPISPP